MQIHMKKWTMMYSDVIINERKAPIALINDELLVGELGETRTEIEARQDQSERNRS